MQWHARISNQARGRTCRDPCRKKWADIGRRCQSANPLGIAPVSVHEVSRQGARFLRTLVIHLVISLATCGMCTHQMRGRVTFGTLVLFVLRLHGHAAWHTKELTRPRPLHTHKYLLKTLHFSDHRPLAVEDNPSNAYLNEAAKCVNLEHGRFTLTGLPKRHSAVRWNTLFFSEEFNVARIIQARTFGPNGTTSQIAELPRNRSTTPSGPQSAQM